MGTIFEELLRKFNEALNENPGEHFTPRDVVHLMVDLMLAGDEARVRAKGVVRTVYDPCCGSGRMLLITKEHITIGLRKNGDLLRPPINKNAEIHLLTRSQSRDVGGVQVRFVMKEPTAVTRTTSHTAARSNDRHAGVAFDYLIANPPYCGTGA
jgi:type I restriction enzyme M protein